jgi:uncharacterized protein YndB with AHSA1/START domain
VATVTTQLSASSETLFGILSDPRWYRRFVIGNRKVRRFDPRWPEEGTELHHHLGVFPVVLADKATVVEADPPKRLVLHAGMGPLAVVEIAFEVASEDGGVTLTVSEFPIRGPLARVWNPLFDWAMALRNRRMLRHLSELAERREAQRSESGAG